MSRSVRPAALLLCLVLLLSLFVGCKKAAPEPEPAPVAPTEAPVPTEVPAPAATPAPTEAPAPSPEPEPEQAVTVSFPNNREIFVTIARSAFGDDADSADVTVNGIQVGSPRWTRRGLVLTGNTLLTATQGEKLIEADTYKAEDLKILGNGRIYNQDGKLAAYGNDSAQSLKGASFLVKAGNSAVTVNIPRVYASPAEGGK